jgi:hypothetical protein
MRDRDVLALLTEVRAATDLDQVRAITDRWLWALARHIDPQLDAKRMAPSRLEPRELAEVRADMLAALERAYTETRRAVGA